MTPDEHYAEAEKLLRPYPSQVLASESNARIAQIHAILALAGYTRVHIRAVGPIFGLDSDAPWSQR